MPVNSPVTRSTLLVGGGSLKRKVEYDSIVPHRVHNGWQNTDFWTPLRLFTAIFRTVDIKLEHMLIYRTMCSTGLVCKDCTNPSSFPQKVEQFSTKSRAFFHKKSSSFPQKPEHFDLGVPVTPCQSGHKVRRSSSMRRRVSVDAASKDGNVADCRDRIMAHPRS
jgi:hypothetical protein